MNRRALLATGALYLLSGCQSLRFESNQASRGIITIGSVIVENNSDKDDTVHVAAVNEGTVIHRGDVRVKSGKTKQLEKQRQEDWTGKSFAFFGNTETFTNQETSGIDNEAGDAQTWKVRYTVKNDGDLKLTQSKL